MDRYIRLQFNGNNLDTGNALIKDAKLLKDIQLTQENQRVNDRNNVKQLVSSTLLFFKDKYKLKELKVIYKKLKDEWDKDAKAV